MIYDTHKSINGPDFIHPKKKIPGNCEGPLNASAATQLVQAISQQWSRRISC
jgi:hypothetical protein